MIDMAMPTVGVFPLTRFHRAVQTTIKEGIVLPRDKAISPQGGGGGGAGVTGLLLLLLERLCDQPGFLGGVSLISHWSV